MYTKILVPLDGSELAECVLPYVKWFIQVSDVIEIIFLRAVEPFRIAGGLEAQVMPEDKENIEQDAAGLAAKYLDKIAAQFKDSRIKIKRVVTIGKPAKTIAGYVGKSDVDLIIMATHGFSGIHHWIRGSVADEIVHAARVPVFLVTTRDRPPDQPESNNARADGK
jgi:nucleotide-binding universal stress UspA family protein